MALNILPSNGEGVSVLAPDGRLHGRIAACLGRALTVALEPSGLRRPFHVARGSQVELQWVNATGVVQASATVESVVADPVPAIELELVGLPEPAERRNLERVGVEVPVSVWSLAQPTRRLEGWTTNLSVGGAQLWLPELAPFVATLEIRLGLPSGAVPASGAIRWRGEPALVGVEFERVSPDSQVRLVEFLAV